MYMFYEPEYVPDPFPQNNTGSICYFNTLIQCLLSLPSVNHTVLSVEGGNYLLREYQRVLRAVLPREETTPHSDRLAFASNNILSALRSQLRGDFGTGQECANEAFVFLLQCFNETSVDNLFAVRYALAVECPKCAKVTSRSTTTSLHVELFSPAKIDTQESFTDWLLSHESPLSYYKCECGVVSDNVYRYECLRLVREIIAIVFNKYHAKENKWFPEELHFPSGEKSLKYRLCAQIEHAGSMHSGHYWAIVLRGGKWYNCNDTSVEPATPGPTPNTYMVFYHLYALE